MSETSDKTERKTKHKLCGRFNTQQHVTLFIALELSTTIWPIRQSNTKPLDRTFSWYPVELSGKSRDWGGGKDENSQFRVTGSENFTKRINWDTASFSQQFLVVKGVLSCLSWAPPLPLDIISLLLPVQLLQLLLNLVH